MLRFAKAKKTGLNAEITNSLQGKEETENIVEERIEDHGLTRRNMFLGHLDLPLVKAACLGISALSVGGHN